MLITKQEIMLQNQHDNQAFQEFGSVMRELLVYEMETSRARQKELRVSYERATVMMRKVAA